MIRMLIPLIVIFLLYLLARTFMERSSREDPIDVDPVDASTERERAEGKANAASADAGGPAHAGRGSAGGPDDDIIDVEPVDVEDGKRGA